MGTDGTHSAAPPHCHSSTRHGNHSHRHRSAESSADSSDCNFSASKPSSRCCSCRTDVESSNSGSVPRIPAEVPWQNRSPAGPERKFFRLLLQLRRKTTVKLHAAHALCPERESLRYPPPFNSSFAISASWKIYSFFPSRQLNVSISSPTDLRR